MKDRLQTTYTKSSGLSILGVLQVVFIVLKLCGLIDWSWKVVLIPLWIELGIFAVILLALTTCALCSRTQHPRLRKK